MAGKKGRDKPEPKAKPEAKRGKKEPKATPAAAAAPKAVAAPLPASNAPAAAETPRPVPQRHGIPMPSRGSKFFGAPNQGKRPGPRVPPAHPVHMPTGNRRGG